MSSVVILHIADLHIDSAEDPNFRLVREALINDVGEICHNYNLRVNSVAVTGDIVNKGGNSDSYLSAKNYLNSLIESLKVDKENIVIAPGNHDAPRRDVVSMLLSKPESELNDKTKFDELWESFGSRFKGFENFIDQLTAIDHVIQYGSYIKDIKVDEKTIRLYSINSSWATTGKDDYRNLRIGRSQLEFLKGCKDSLKAVDLEIAIIHHPLDWLKDSEKAMLIDYLTDSRKLNASILLHGHVHDGYIASMKDPDSSLLTLVSGIGYPDSENEYKGQPKLTSCRYAIYKFDLETGVLDVWLRITNSKGKFASDTCLYDAGKKDGHFSLRFRTGSENQGLSDDLSFELFEFDAIPITAGWSGRRNELSQLSDGSIRVAAITGVGGQGKSWLASEFLRRNSRGIDSQFDYGLWVDCRELPESLHYKIIQLLDKLSQGKESAALFRDEPIEETSKRFLRYLQKDKILVVFDNIDAYVNIDTEFVMGELKPIVEVLLKSEQKSFALLTCRPPINDHRSNFRQDRRAHV